MATLLLSRIMLYMKTLTIHIKQYIDTYHVHDDGFEKIAKTDTQIYCNTRVSCKLL